VCDEAVAGRVVPSRPSTRAARSAPIETMALGLELLCPSSARRDRIRFGRNGERANGPRCVRRQEPRTLFTPFDLSRRERELKIVR
jgi:hypothetical protein